MTDCYTLFRDAYHLAGLRCRICIAGMTGGVTARISILTIWRQRVLPCPTDRGAARDVLLCCFGSSVPNHAAIYCGDGELLHHIPEQLSKRERYTDKWQRRTHSLWRHRAWHASAFTGICNDLVAVSTFV
ncbi:NlpC/P60 family protein [Escherichia coli]|uniref:NlpC/P60 family protein n=1 Tax=Escherichia coli TaxID=562 RepID=UPI003890A84F